MKGNLFLYIEKAIPTRNRAQLINDAFSLAQANLLDATKPFEIIKYLSEEVEYLPWMTALSRLTYTIDMLEATSVFAKFQKYLIDLITPIYNKLGWDEKKSDSWLDRLLRTSVLSFACQRGLPDCVNKAKSYYADWMQQENDNK